jgi:hypothetical protein
MRGQPCAGDPCLLAACALDEFVAQTVWQALQAGLPVPANFLDWAAGDALRMIQQLVSRQVPAQGTDTAALRMALRCAVRHWTAPWIVARFAALRPLFPELTVGAEGADISVLVRTGRWRCMGACPWKLCEAQA